MSNYWAIMRTSENDKQDARCAILERKKGKTWGCERPATLLAHMKEDLGNDALGNTVFGNETYTCNICLFHYELMFDREALLKMRDDAILTRDTKAGKDDRDEDSAIQ